MPEPTPSAAATDISAAGRFAGELVASDRSYFLLGAAVKEVGPAEVLWMPGFTQVPAGCVTWVDPDRDGVGGSTDWVDSAIATMHQVGARLLRIYCQEPGEALSGRLHDEGFTKRSEIGFVTTEPLASGREDVGLRPVEGDAGWKEKMDLHGEADLASDGHGGAADGFAALERARCATGAMSAFLIEVDGEVAGAVATLTQGRLLRVKNLYIAPGFRGRGVGATVLHRAGELVAERGLDAMGIIGVAGTRGSALYMAAGLTPVAELIEWSRPARLGR